MKIFPHPQEIRKVTNTSMGEKLLHDIDINPLKVLNKNKLIRPAQCGEILDDLLGRFSKLILVKIISSAYNDPKS